MTHQFIAHRILGAQFYAQWLSDRHILLALRKVIIEFFAIEMRDYLTRYYGLGI